MSPLYHKDDIIRSFDYLCNSRCGFTELLAIHRLYRPGKENLDENRMNKAYPKMWYARKSSEALSFVSRNCKDHTCYFGVNPRPRILKNEKGFLRSAREEDIKVLSCFYFDLDCIDKKPSDEHIAEIELFISRTERFFDDIGINRPVKAFSGRGFHLFFSPSPICVSKHPDIKKKLLVFKAQFEDSFKNEFRELGIAIDSTLDLRRMVKIPGTKKANPSIKRISRFYGTKRQDDKALRDYLIGLDIPQAKSPMQSIQIADILPERFQKLLSSSQLLHELWDGNGKTDGDLSSSGYDFSIIKYCIKKGITDVGDLATILANRPEGAFQKRNKGSDYIKRTISKAIMSC